MSRLITFFNFKKFKTNEFLLPWKLSHTIKCNSRNLTEKRTNTLKMNISKLSNKKSMIYKDEKNKIMMKDKEGVRDEFLNCEMSLNLMIESLLIRNDYKNIDKILKRLEMNKQMLNQRLAIEIMLRIDNELKKDEIIEKSLENMIIKLKKERNDERIMSSLKKIMLTPINYTFEMSEARKLCKDLEEIKYDWLHPKYWLKVRKIIPLELDKERRLEQFENYLKLDKLAATPLLYKFYEKMCLNSEKLVLNKNDKDIIKHLNGLKFEYLKTNFKVAENAIIYNQNIYPSLILEDSIKLSQIQDKMCNVLNNKLRDEYLSNLNVNIFYLLFDINDIKNITYIAVNTFLNSSIKKQYNFNFETDFTKDMASSLETYYCLKWRYYYNIDNITNLINKFYNDLKINCKILPRHLWTFCLINVFSCSKIIEPIPMTLLIQNDMSNYLFNVMTDLFVYGKNKYFIGNFGVDKIYNIKPNDELRTCFKNLSIDSDLRTQKRNDLYFLSLLKTQSESSLSSIWLSLNTNTDISSNKCYLKSLGTLQNYKNLCEKSDLHHLNPILDTLTKLNSTKFVLNKNIFNVLEKFISSPYDFPGLYQKKNLIKYYTLYKFMKNSNKSFYLKYESDSRGRCYPQTILETYFNSELLNGFLLFSNRKSINDQGKKWLKILYTSLVLNPNDRDNNSKKLCNYCDENMQLIKDTVKDPFKNKWWQYYKDSWKILALCFEIVNSENKPNYSSSFPIFLDGTCNMFQHLSALCHDNVLQKYVNFYHIPKSNILSVYDYLLKTANKTIPVNIPTIDFQPLFTRKLFKTILFKYMKHEHENVVYQEIQKRFSDNDKTEFKIIIDEISLKVHQLIIDSMPTLIKFKVILFEFFNIYFRNG